jgi:hypothetical protein
MIATMPSAMMGQRHQGLDQRNAARADAGGYHAKSFQPPGSSTNEPCSSRSASSTAGGHHDGGGGGSRQVVLHHGRAQDLSATFPVAALGVDQAIDPGRRQKAHAASGHDDRRSGFGQYCRVGQGTDITRSVQREITWNPDHAPRIGGDLVCQCLSAPGVWAFKPDRRRLQTVGVGPGPQHRGKEARGIGGKVGDGRVKRKHRIAAVAAGHAVQIEVRGTDVAASMNSDAAATGGRVVGLQHATTSHIAQYRDRRRRWRGERVLERHQCGDLGAALAFADPGWKVQALVVQPCAAIGFNAHGRLAARAR